MFDFFPHVFIFLAASLIVVYFARKYPRGEYGHSIDSIRDHMKKTASTISKSKKSKISDIKSVNQSVVNDSDAESVDVSVFASKNRRRRPSSVTARQKEVERAEKLDKAEIERQKSLETKKQMHENVLKVIDRLSHIAKKAGAGVKNGAVSFATFVKEKRAEMKRKNMPQSEKDKEKIFDLLEKAAKDLGSSDFSLAESSYIEVIKIDPKNVRAYKGLSELYEKQENFDDAMASLEQVMKLDPLDYESKNKIAELRKMKREKKSAKAVTKGAESVDEKVKEKVA